MGGIGHGARLNQMVITCSTYGHYCVDRCRLIPQWRRSVYDDGDYLTVRAQWLIGIIHAREVAFYKVHHHVEQTPFMRRRSPPTCAYIWRPELHVFALFTWSSQANEVANYVLSLIEARPRPWDVS